MNLLAGDVLGFSVQRLALDPNGFGGNWTGLAVDINSVAAVPEPASLALMLLGLGLGVVVGVSRRRREC